MEHVLSVICNDGVLIFERYQNWICWFFCNVLNTEHTHMQIFKYEVLILTNLLTSFIFYLYLFVLDTSNFLEGLINYTEETIKNFNNVSFEVSYNIDEFY